MTYLEELFIRTFSTETGPNVRYYFEMVDLDTGQNVTRGGWYDEGRRVEVRITVGMDWDGNYQQVGLVKFTPLDKMILSRLFRD